MNRLGRARVTVVPQAHEVFDEVAEAAADVVIRRYSTSFGIASRLLAEPVRTHVRTVYALVRVADEVVDAPRPGQEVGERAHLLDELHAETLAAMRTGQSVNLVVHAFARTARTCGIGPELVDPFFESMRMDLTRTVHDEASFKRYVHGSAEVVGLMCLRAFLLGTDDPQGRYERLSAGACALGAAFQKVNFLRDLAADHDDLGRTYFPGMDVDSFDCSTRDAWLDDVDADLATAAAAICELPASSRRAVLAAHALFSELSRRLRRTEPESIRSRRVRVPSPRKAQLVVLALARGAA